MPVHLLQSADNPDLYCIMAHDPHYWGTLIGPYPLQEPPFAQDFEMGYRLRLLFQIDGTPTDDEGLILTFNGHDVQESTDYKFVWLNGMGINTSSGAIEYVVVTAIVGGVAGTARFDYPMQQDGLVFPRGEGAMTQRETDFRDASPETAAKGHRAYVTSCTVHYSGPTESEPYGATCDLPLDGTETTFNYAHGAIDITGQADASVDVYTRAIGKAAFQHGYYQSVTLDGAGEATLDGLPAGEYVLLGYDSAGGEFTDFAAPVTVEVGWGETEEAGLSFSTFAADDDDLYWGYWMQCPGVPLANTMVKCKIDVYDGEDLVDCYVLELGETDGSGYGVVGHDGKDVNAGDGYTHDYTTIFVDDGDFRGCHATMEENDWRPFHSVGGRIVVQEPQLAYKYHGQGTYPHLYGRAGGMHLVAGDYCPAGYATVEMHEDAYNGCMYSDPVPRIAGPWDPCTEDPPTDECAWELWAGSDLLDAANFVEGVWIGGEVPASPEDIEYDGGNNEAEYDVAGRIRGAFVDWSSRALVEPQRPVDYGMEFASYKQDPIRVMALLANPPEPPEDYPHPAGFSHMICYYCGHPTLHDPGDGASRFGCSFGPCGRDSRAYWDLYPAAEGDYIELRIATPDALNLTETRLTRRAWYRPEAYDWGSGSAPGETYRYLASHVTMGSWDHSGGFSAGTSMSATGVAAGRDIGPAQPKVSITESPSEDVEIRIQAKRTDGTSLYFYGTMRTTDAAGDIVRFTWVLPDTGDAEANRRAIVPIYEADEEGWPCTLGDAANEVVACWARQSGGAWQTTAGWLSAGAFDFVNDNPSYRHTCIIATRMAVMAYVAHRIAEGEREPDLAIGVDGRIYEVHIEGDDVVARYRSRAEVPWERRMVIATPSGTLQLNGDSLDYAGLGGFSPERPQIEWLPDARLHVQWSDSTGLRETFVDAELGAA
jgi:hypothetical protein